MAYTAAVSRINPSLIVILIDWSKSMQDLFGGPRGSGQTKAHALADVVNAVLQELVLKCTKDRDVRDYYYVCVIGYGAEVGPALGGALAGKDIVPLSQLAHNYVRIEDRMKKIPDGVGGVVEQLSRKPIWIEPKAENGTPMYRALDLAAKIVARWLKDHPDCFPPIVINVTDGEATDGDAGDPEEAAERLTDLSSRDGGTLLFNVHLSSHAAAPIEFPEDEAGLPDEFARKLFRMSSVLPPAQQAAARAANHNVGREPRGFVFNADFAALAGFLDIGTRPANMT